VAFLTNYVHGGEGCAAVWQIAICRACVRWPLLSVRFIARQRHGAVGAAGQGMNQPQNELPPPTIHTNITLYHTRSKMESLCPTDRCLHGSLTKAARSLSFGLC